MTSKDSIERELKFAQADLEALRSRLLELEAERLGPAVFEENWLIDRDGELGDRASILPHIRWKQLLGTQ